MPSEPYIIKKVCPSCANVRVKTVGLVSEIMCKLDNGLKHAMFYCTKWKLHPYIEGLLEVDARKSPRSRIPKSVL